MEIKKVSKRVNFRNGYEARFEFTLVKTEAESYYGNGTSVVMVDGNGRADSREVFDTRYDVSLKADGSNFASWVDDYITYRFANLMV